MGLPLQFFGVTFLESLDPAGGIHQFLFAGIEGMAMGADGDGDLLSRGNGLDHVAAGADDLHRIDFGVNLLFHRRW